MEGIRLRLTGRPRIRTDGAWQDVPSEKRFLLLAYLACQDGWVPRDKLAFLFWPDVDEPRARGNLRQLLRRARALPFAGDVRAAPNAIRWDVASDVRAFRQAIGIGAWGVALERYGGELLAGVHVEDAPELDGWIEVEREALHREWRQASLKRADELVRSGASGEAAGLLRDVLAHDVLAEDVLQAYLRSALVAGQRDEALRLYASFETKLAAELALVPLESTTTLVEQVRVAGASSAPAQEPAGARTTVSARPNLPVPSSPLIGRDLELAELAGMLADEACRLVTLIGPGGCGKSRLALEAAHERSDSYADGCRFVPLAPVGDAERLVDVVSEHVGVPRTDRGDPARRLGDYLADKEMLIVLDNVEHVIEAAGLVVDLLDAAPRLRVIATSREPLGFREEFRFELSGLSYPTTVDTVGPGWSDTYDAVRLFVHRARQQVPSFTITEARKTGIVDLCRLLDGSPLGLELAAAWVRTLEPSEIVEELRRDVGGLAVDRNDLPERHRSLRAVFDHSWALLSDSERHAMAAFSVFRGGAGKDASLRVTGASLRTLLRLVSQSLLTRSEHGRFHVLEPLRQHASRYLASSPERESSVRTVHAAQYAEFLVERAGALRGGSGQQDAFAVIEAEIDNVRTAWAYGCERADRALLARCANPYGLFLERRSRFQEGTSAFGSALRALERRADSPPEVRVWLATFRTYLGEPDSAARALRLVARSDGRDASPTTRADALWRWGVAERSRGDYVAAETRIEEALALYRELDDAWGAANALNTSGGLAVVAGDLERARTRLEACTELRSGIGDAWGASVPLLNLGTVHRYLGRMDEAEQYSLASLEAARANENDVGVSYVLGTLASVDAFRGDFGAALERARESLAIRRSVGDRRLIANALVNVATVQIASGDGDGASTSLDEAASLFAEVMDRQGVATTVSADASRLLAVGRVVDAEEAYGRALRLESAIGHAYGVHQAREGLARVAVRAGDLATAESEALAVVAFAHEAGFGQLLLEALTTFAECASRRGDVDLARRIARCVARHDGASFGLRRRAIRMVDEDGSSAETDEPSPDATVQALVASLLA